MQTSSIWVRRSLTILVEYSLFWPKTFIIGPTSLWVVAAKFRMPPQVPKDLTTPLLKSLLHCLKSCLSMTIIVHPKNKLKKNLINPQNEYSFLKIYPQFQGDDREITALIGSRLERGYFNISSRT